MYPSNPFTHTMIGRLLTSNGLHYLSNACSSILLNSWCTTMLACMHACFRPAAIAAAAPATANLTRFSTRSSLTGHPSHHCCFDNSRASAFSSFCTTFPLYIFFFFLYPSSSSLTPLFCHIFDGLSSTVDLFSLSAVGSRTCLLPILLPPDDIENGITILTCGQRLVLR